MNLRGYVYKLNLNERQKEFFNKSFGCSRYVYNYMLNIYKDSIIKDKKYLSEYELSNLLTKIKK